MGAVLCKKLEYLSAMLDRRRSIADEYKQAIGQNPYLTFQAVYRDTVHSYHLFVVKPDNRARFIDHLSLFGIESSLHYAIPLHKQKVFADITNGVILPVSEDLFAKCVTVPSSPFMTDDEVAYVSEALKKYRR